RKSRPGSLDRSRTLPEAESRERAHDSARGTVACHLRFSEGMDKVKAEILANDMLERAAALSYYLLFALVAAGLFVLWPALARSRECRRSPTLPSARPAAAPPPRPRPP